MTMAAPFVLFGSGRWIVIEEMVVSVLPLPMGACPGQSASLSSADPAVASVAQVRQQAILEQKLRRVM
jgi:hypothetical protein